MSGEGRLRDGLREVLDRMARDLDRSVQGAVTAGSYTSAADSASPPRDLLADLTRAHYQMLALGPIPRRIIVHDIETERDLLRQIPRSDGPPDPLAGLPLEIDPKDAPEPGCYYVDYRPSSEWSNRRAAP